MFRQILIGVDEHEGSSDAITLAKKLLAADGGLTLAHVFTGDPHLYGDEPTISRSAPISSQSSCNPRPAEGELRHRRCA